MIMGTNTELEKILKILAGCKNGSFTELDGSSPVFEFTVEVDPEPWEIESVKSFDDKTTVVFFKDGTKEVAVCTEDDTYSLEQGISVCLAKKLVGGKENYNKIIKTAAKQYRDEREATKKVQEEKQKAHEERMRIQQNRAKKKRKKEYERIVEIVEQLAQSMTESGWMTTGEEDE